ncbi:MAG: hypothetical protein AAF598_12670 [Bacteroidota bacterium]
MYQIACFFLLFSLSADVYAQAEVDSTILEAINEEVWIPFMQAYADHDVELYLSLHAEEVLRATPWGIRKGADFRKQIRASWSIPNPSKKQIEFRFEHRIHTDSIAYEVGYYKLVYPDNKPEDQVHVGRFHVVLKKIDNRWYIAQDWDDNDINGSKVSVADFERLPAW